MPHFTVRPSVMISRHFHFFFLFFRGCLRQHTCGICICQFNNNRQSEASLLTMMNACRRALIVAAVLMSVGVESFSPGRTRLHSYSHEQSRRFCRSLLPPHDSLFSESFSDARQTRNLCDKKPFGLSVSRLGSLSRPHVFSTALKRRFTLFRKLVVSTLVAIWISSVLWCSSANAGETGGRLGGSFGPCHSSKPSTPSMSYRHTPSTMPYRRSRYYRSSCRPRSHSVVYRTSPTVVYRPNSQAVFAAPVYFTAVAGAVVYAIVKEQVSGGSNNRRRGALGAGVSVASLTVAIDVPDRDAKDSLLVKLKQLSNAAKTGTRRGVQDLITNVTLELLRREKSIVSAASSSDHYYSSREAQMEFNRLSVYQRSKVEKETINKFGGADMGSTDEAVTDNYDVGMPSATTAVVTITVSIDGSQTKLPRITSRADLIKALSILASHVPVEDCLQSAEVLWAPEARSETLSKEDLIADYPELYPI